MDVASWCYKWEGWIGWYSDGEEEEDNVLYNVKSSLGRFPSNFLFQYSTANNSTVYTCATTTTAARFLETISNWRRRWTRRLRCWRRTLQRLWNGRDFSDVTLVRGHWRRRRRTLYWLTSFLWKSSVKGKEEGQLAHFQENCVKEPQNVFCSPICKLFKISGNHFRISIQMLSNASDFFDVTLVWSDYKDGGANEIKTSRKRGSSQVIFMLVRKCWQNNYKRRLLTSQASVFHRLLVKDDLSKHALAFTWWAPHGPKLDDKKGEEDNDTVDNIGRRRVRFLNE